MVMIGCGLLSGICLLSGPSDLVYRNYWVIHFCRACHFYPHLKAPKSVKAVLKEESSVARLLTGRNQGSEKGWQDWKRKDKKSVMQRGGTEGIESSAATTMSCFSILLPVVVVMLMMVVRIIGMMGC